MEARIAVLEQIAKDTKEVLVRLDTRMDRFETRMDRLDTRFDRLDTRVNGLGDWMSSDFKWLVSAGAAATIGLAGLMAHGFHWL